MVGLIPIGRYGCVGCTDVTVAVTEFCVGSAVHHFLAEVCPRRGSISGGGFDGIVVVGFEALAER